MRAGLRADFLPRTEDNEGRAAGGPGLTRSGAALSGFQSYNRRLARRSGFKRCL